VTSTVSLQHPPPQVPATISMTAHYPPNHGHLHPSVPVLSDSNAPPFPPLGHHMPKFLPTDSSTSTVHSPPQMSSTHCQLTLSLGLTKEVSNQIRHWVGSAHTPLPAVKEAKPSTPPPTQDTLSHSLGSEGASKKHIPTDVPESPTRLNDHPFGLYDYSVWSLRLFP